MGSAEAAYETNGLAFAINSQEQAEIVGLRTKLKNQNELVCPLDDIYLLSFLRYKNNDVDEAYKAIFKWWKLLEAMQSYTDYSIPSNKHFTRENRFSITLKNRDAQGRQVFVWRMNCWNVSKRNLLQNFATNFPITHTMSERQLTQLHGVVVMYDIAGMTHTHLQHSTPSAIKTALNMTQCIPLKIKAVHVINHPKIFDILYFLGKPFLKEKLKKRIHLHGYDYHDSLHGHLPRSILPKCYGGLLEDDAFDEEGFEELMMKKKQCFVDFFNAQKFGFTSS